MKDMWQQKLMADDIDNSAASCARAEDLVAYLYGEIEGAAAQDFKAHAQSCVSCQTELAGFRQVRVSIGEWRQQALGSLSATTAATTAHAIIEPVNVVAQRPRSALAAVREFFTLSPVWMRAATAAAGLIFCALIALAVAHYFEQPKTVIVEKVVPAKQSEEQSAQKRDEPVKQQDARDEIAPEVTPPEPTDTTASAPKDNRLIPKVKRNLKQEATPTQSLARAPKLKISPQESRDIARDLRLVASKEEEEDLPRLSDLLGESN